MIWPFKKAAWPKSGRPEPRMYDYEVGHMETCGFYIHMVPLGGDAEQYINAHTHGVPESIEGQLDFQTLAGIPANTIGRIMWDLYDRAKAGERFRDGDRSTISDGKLPVRFKKVREGHPDRGDVLRVLLPCKNMKLPGEEGHDPTFFPLQATLDTEGPLPWGAAPGCNDVPQCAKGPTGPGETRS